MTKLMQQKKECFYDEMKTLAEKTGLQFDGDGTDLRLHADGDWRIYVNVVAMGRDVYEKWEEALNSVEVKGSGFAVYAWTDCGGFDYWLAEGSVYQQITVSIEDVGLVLKNPKALNDAVAELDRLLARFSRYSTEFAGYPTAEEIDAAQAKGES